MSFLVWCIWEWWTQQPIFTRAIHFSRTNTLYLCNCPAKKRVCVCVCACFAPEAEKKNTHYKHFASVFPRHAIASSDSGQSKVLEMPEEPSLTCMRARAGLWCNCSNGEGQRPAQLVRGIKAQMWTQHLGFLAAVSVLFEDGGAILHGKHFLNRWKSSVNCVAAKRFCALRVLTCSTLLRSCILSLDPHDREPFIQAVRLFESLPPACVVLFTRPFWYWI